LSQRHVAVGAGLVDQLVQQHVQRLSARVHARRVEQQNLRAIERQDSEDAAARRLRLGGDDRELLAQQAGQIIFGQDALVDQDLP